MTGSFQATILEHNFGKFKAAMDDFNPVLALEGAKSTEDEISCLEKLRQCLCPQNSCSAEDEMNDEDLDTQWLREASRGENNENMNPFPCKIPEDIVQGQEQLNRFTFYLFERRYGWSESQSHGDLTGKDMLSYCGSRPDSRSGRPTSWNIESKFKGRLNELLDEFLKW